MNRHKKYPGVALWLLLVCFLLTLGPKPQEISTAGGAEVEVENTPLLALTYDDGPGGASTEKLLDGLALREVPATFFLVGQQIPGQEALVRRMAAEGHQIGLHTQSHVMLTKAGEEQIRQEITENREQLTELLGEGDYWLRPPYGKYNDSVKHWANSPLVLWSVDPEDWKDRNRDRIVEAVVSRVQDGDIILMHDIYDSSVEAALEIVDRLTDRGFTFVTVKQLMDLRGEKPVPGNTVSALPAPKD